MSISGLRAGGLTGAAGPRTNHYETLGISPTAAADEIDRAFARQGNAFRAHAFGGLAEVCIAYETLRDPAKRRAYDASLGLKREPSVTKFAAGARQALVAKGPAHDPIGRPATNEAPTAAPQEKPVLPLGPAVDSQEPRISLAVSPSLSLEEELVVEARPVDWKRTGIVLGGIVAAACVVGGLAGWWSSNAIGETPQPGNIVSLSLPPAKTAAPPETPPIAAEPVESVAEVRNERPKPVATATAPMEAAPISAEPDATEEPLPESEPSLSAEATETPAAEPVAAAMPLPNRVIARTIERIGYSCGSVASTAPVEGAAAGVFKVTCSSGQSYRASPVNGRYRFKRWGRR